MPGCGIDALRSVAAGPPDSWPEPACSALACLDERLAKASALMKGLEGSIRALPGDEPAARQPEVEGSHLGVQRRPPGCLPFDSETGVPGATSARRLSIGGDPPS